MESWILMILVIIPGVWSGDWRVTFENQCALKGTSVVIECNYDYPFGHLVKLVSWHKVQHESGQYSLFPLRLGSHLDHFEYVGTYRGDCSLKINNVQYSDEGAYYFHFVTTFNRWTSKTSMRLSVKELTTVVQPSTVTEGDNVRLTCVTGCPTPTTIVWFKDGHLVPKPVFQARREDAGRYYCAVLGQETVRSASVALNVQYAPKKVTLSVSPSGDIFKGSSVTLTCSSDANPAVTQEGYSLYKDGEFISSGQNHTISDIQPSHSGLYYCQASNNMSRRGVNLVNSTGAHVDVRYRPMSIKVSVDPPYIVEGSAVNLTCSCAANPAAENYSWYKMAESPSSMLPMGSGQVLSLRSVEASHTGLYLCQVRNSLGENNSTEVLLSVMGKEHGIHPLPVLAGIGTSLVVTLVIALFLFWRKKRSFADKNQTVFDLRISGRGSGSSANEDQSDTVYANIDTFASSPPPVTAAQDILSASTHKHDENMDFSSLEDEVTYSTVTIKPRNHGPSRHINSSRTPQKSWSKAGENYDSVIYATVVKSS